MYNDHFCFPMNIIFKFALFSSVNFWEITSVGTHFHFKCPVFFYLSYFNLVPKISLKIMLLLQEALRVNEIKFPRLLIEWIVMILDTVNTLCCACDKSLTNYRITKIQWNHQFFTKSLSSTKSYKEFPFLTEAGWFWQMHADFGHIHLGLILGVKLFFVEIEEIPNDSHNVNCC